VCLLSWHSLAPVGLSILQPQSLCAQFHCSRGCSTWCSTAYDLPWVAQAYVWRPEHVVRPEDAS
jgi:hypothetical protein